MQTYTEEELNQLILWRKQLITAIQKQIFDLFKMWEELRKLNNILDK